VEVLMIGIEGTTEVCLFHFFDSLEKLSEDERLKEASEFARFLDLSGESLNKWVERKNFPMGLNLLRTRYYLQQAGYTIVEIKDIPESIQRLNELIARRKIDAREASDKMGFSDIAELTRVLLGKRITENKTKIIEAFLQNVDLSNNVVLPDNKITSSLVSPEIKSLDEQIKGSGIFEELFKPVLVDALEALYYIEKIVIPQVRDLLQDKDEETRVLFRKGLKDGFLFNLSNKTYETVELLNALCSENALKTKFNQLKLKTKS